MILVITMGALMLLVWSFCQVLAIQLLLLKKRLGLVMVLVGFSGMVGWMAHG